MSFFFFTKRQRRLLGSSRDENYPTPLPLELGEILEQVYTSLEIQDLKECRRVSRLWNEISTQVLLKRNDLRVNKNRGIMGFLKRLILIVLWVIHNFGLMGQILSPISLYFKLLAKYKIRNLARATELDHLRDIVLGLRHGVFIVNGEIWETVTQIESILEPAYAYYFWVSSRNRPEAAIFEEAKSILQEVETLIENMDIT